MPRQDHDEQRMVSAGLELAIRLAPEPEAEQRLIDAAGDYWQLASPGTCPSPVGRFFAQRAGAVFAAHRLDEADQERMREQVGVEVVEPRCDADGSSLGYVRSRKELHEVATPRLCRACRQGEAAHVA